MQTLFGKPNASFVLTINTERYNNKVSIVSTVLFHGMSAPDHATVYLFSFINWEKRKKNKKENFRKIISVVFVSKRLKSRK